MGFAPNPNQDALQRSLSQPRNSTMPISQRFEGFDFVRPQDTKKSAKDAFADLSQRAPVAPIHDKNALGQWFDQHILPGMNALGHGAQRAQGDKFRFKNWQGEFDVDFGRGAGADGGALAWMADPVGGAPSAERGRAPLMAGQSGLMAQILASLQDMQQPDPQALLLQQLTR